MLKMYIFQSIYISIQLLLKTNNQVIKVSKPLNATKPVLLFCKYIQLAILYLYTLSRTRAKNLITSEVCANLVATINGIIFLIS